MYFKRDFVLLDGALSTIESINATEIVIKGKKYTRNDIKPIALDDEKARLLCLTKRIPAALKIGLNGVNTDETSVEGLSVGRDFEKTLDKKQGDSWNLQDIPENFLEEHHIRYVHELQHYIATKTCFFLIELKKKHEVCH